MEHWIEPQVLGDYQRTGYNSPLMPGGQPLPGVAPPGVEHYRNRPGQLAGDVSLPNLPPPGIEHYVNRPGQLGSMHRLTSNLPTLLMGAVVGVLAWPWLKKTLKIGK
jgi:hypothetical protein